MASFFDQAPLYDNSRSTGSIRDLLLMQGEQRAQAARQAGDNWARTIGGIGNAVAGGVAAYGEHKAEQKQQAQLKARDAAGLDIAQRWDGKDPKELYMTLAKVGGPEYAEKYGKTVMAFHAKPSEDAKTELSNMYIAAKGVSDLEDPMLAEAGWDAFKNRYGATAVDRLGIPAQLLEGGWTPEHKKGLEGFLKPVAATLGIKDDGAKDDDTVVVGGNLVNRKTGKVVFAEPVKPPATKTAPVGSFEDFVLRKLGPDATADQVLAARQQYESAGRAPKEDKGPAALTPTAESNVVAKLAGQWTKANATQQVLNRNISLMDTGLDAARKGDLAAGSQAVLVTFQKILDPTSVVRESEYARSAEGQALMAQIQGKYEQMLKGGAGVPLPELEKYANLAKKMAQATAGNVEGTRKRIQATAKRYNIPEELVLEEMAGPSSAAAAPAAPAGLPRAGSKAEYDAIPAGAMYVGSDGQVRKKGS